MRLCWGSCYYFASAICQGSIAWPVTDNVTLAPCSSNILWNSRLSKHERNICAHLHASIERTVRFLKRPEQRLRFERPWSSLRG
eukprot:3377062-Amphidinium_carterae.1